MAQRIRKYNFFKYSVNEALFLSEKEEVNLKIILQNIQNEYHSTIDQFSQRIIISQVETLLNYASRFYKRQFITRRIINHQILDKLERILEDYFSGDDIVSKGLPTVQYLAESLHL